MTEDGKGRIPHHSRTVIPSAQAQRAEQRQVIAATLYRPQSIRGVENLYVTEVKTSQFDGDNNIG